MKDRYILEGREPSIVFRQFEDICAIPHGSGNEKALGEHIISIADEYGYSHEKDEIGNILVRIPASKGCESAPSMCIQGHMDMVLAKKEGVSLDMDTESVELVLEGDVLRANGTTLGADNAVGLCNMLAVMRSPGLPHPALELLFTVQEERGLVGMRAFDPSKLRSRKMLNMDMGDPGLLEISSAGTSKIHFRKEYETRRIPLGYLTFKVSVSGLRGGHSGLEIGKNRGDGVVIVSRILSEVLDRSENSVLCALASPQVSAGIPSFASFTIALPAEDSHILGEVRDEFERILSHELPDDPDMALTVSPVRVENCLARQDSLTVSDFLLCVPNGVFRRSEEHLNWITSSSTLAIIELRDGAFYGYMSYRVNDDLFRENIEVRLRSTCRLCGIGMELVPGAPAWPESRDSSLRKTAKKVYRELFGEEMTEDSCHGSVEVSVIAQAVPEMEIIGTAPYSRGAHTPDEWLDLTSIGPFWEWLKKLLEALSKEQS
ncbi:MAG: beta-Ala-His dipeptidase [Eubacteriaceae bacterium]|nr:beta-Ala-His dipeptidase [Eubacteriaceae bacterium]